MRRLLAALCAALLLALTACTPRSQTPERHELTYLDVFDTVTTLVAYGGTGEDFSAEAGRIHAELLDYHRLYDIYNEYEGINNLKTVNDNAGGEPVEVDQRIIDLLVFAREMYEATGGKTDVALGAVLRIWHDARETAINDPSAAYVPTEEELEAANGHTDFGSIVIDEANGTVQITDPEASIDVGGIAKGYAVEMASRDAAPPPAPSRRATVSGSLASSRRMRSARPVNSCTR